MRLYNRLQNQFVHIHTVFHTASRSFYFNNYYEIATSINRTVQHKLSIEIKNFFITFQNSLTIIVKGNWSHKNAKNCYLLIAETRIWSTEKARGRIKSRTKFRCYRKKFTLHRPVCQCRYFQRWEDKLRENRRNNNSVPQWVAFKRGEAERQHRSH